MVAGRYALTGAAALLLSLALLLLPVSGDGVSGNALRPEYGAFGWVAYGPLPAEPTADELRAAGVRLPQDAVAERRTVAAGVGLVGLALLGMGAVRRRSAPRRRRR